MAQSMNKFINFSFKILEWIAIACMASFVLIIFVQVLSRALKISAPWADELARYLLIYATFVGSAIATRRGQQLGVDYFINKMPRALKKIVNYSMFACSIIFQGILLIYGTRLTILSLKTVSPILQWSTGLIFLVIPITAALTMAMLIQQQIFTKKEVEE